MRITILLALLAFPTCGPRLLAGEANPLDRCNVVWDSPSKNSSGSMPIGNGDIGLNTWVEENGDLLLPQTPGLGFNFDEKALKKYALDKTRIWTTIK